ncbi:hypothetical protein CAPTEDRAFT_166299 [Capitella teleta]|uniref:Transporter n=1 Tax=Capitella teleta TaxID=283909 RepID=R7ULY8_CAPTE|nr:hypothetical protein CAPTEDRAFT_166299 [Capitella teleta]|eukprot:ELU04952.1 hypothetical protein CAPTEDRAFT_166299 [Capitella teleta]
MREKRIRHQSTSSFVGDDDENQIRGNWTGRLDFLMSCMSYAVGLGNVWRYPFKCYENGGGAFVFPFLIMLVFTGIPLKMISVCSFTACRVQGQSSQMMSCNQQNGTWMNNTCLSGLIENSTSDDIISINGINYVAMANGKVANVTYKSPSDEYFQYARYVLDISEGIEDVGGIRWQIALCLLLAWTVACICMIKGIKSSGKVVYFTAIFPYIVLTILLIRGVTLPGSVNGIMYYITPQWDKLLTAKVWGDAAIQIFYSLSAAWGGLITLSSYNKFNNNCLRDTYIVCVGDALASLFAGLVIFAIVGYMAHELDITIDKAATGGAGLAFIAYPEVVTRLPASPLWAILFFLMLITLGLGTMLANINTVHTTILDNFPDLLRVGKRPSYVMVGVCSLGFIMGLPMCTRGGIYIVELFDDYCSTYSVNCIAITELVALGWIYGFDRLRADIKLMIGQEISIVWKYAWQYVSPIAILGITVFTISDFKPTTYETYVFPVWAELVGLFLGLTSFFAMPLTAIWKVMTVEDKSMTYLQRVKFLCKPTDDWGPQCGAIPSKKTKVANDDVRNSVV